MKVQSTMQNKLLRYKWALILFSIFTVTNAAYAQNCDCESAFLWVKQTFEENDAGFQYVIDKKGISEYEKHNTDILEKIKTAKDNTECAGIISEYLSFFRKGHIGIDVLKKDTVENSTQTTMQSFPNWEKLNIDTVEFKKYLDSKKNIDFEGIWDDWGTYRIGIKRVDNQYVGSIISSQIEEWKPEQIKFRIYPDSAIYYMGNHSAKLFKRVTLASNNFIYFGDGISFERIYPKSDDNFLQSLIDQKPYLEQLNKKTLYLRIPSFESKYCQTIDSVISNNKKSITKTENLIIDLRFNGGGSDGCWQSIIPYIYTNPIRRKSFYMLSTELNNQEDNNIWKKKYIKELNENLGKFVLLDNKKDSLQFSKFYKIPKNVAIIVDENCASATEQFLLTARQSKKVKIFGRITYGSLDFSEITNRNSPCNDFVLYYAILKDVDVDDYPVDGIGIQPDFYLGDDIPEYKWVEYVNDILNYH